MALLGGENFIFEICHISTKQEFYADFKNANLPY
jgi:hypothetical protein